ncbi:S8 family peptidase [Ruminiclostridium cellulolyticum]|uniref:Peptidase S8 and S53 subtilisin kexin sedolisin n=1 Tax=Ruminiclostridium cellulolyticum (strain ATCC 35319 / DSM 5812 / JCM 6584 / H10) TaxID=394503 RepID=B8I6X5_RUMCH|nr:S8 family serine peptidase [Ruminiclostridium cellulolyticum]ACL76967.1 peptidase S8 and S53 subtilisin kexin sedolisin [Ruminiclostridium cellulolyticum H10]
MKLRIFFAVVLAAMLLTVSALAAEAEAIRVAVIDTGISETAIPKTNLSSGRNYILPNKTTTDTVGHGTAIASIIVGSETAGIKGICPEAMLVPLVYYAKNEDGGTIKGDGVMLAKIIRDAVEVFDCKILNISSGVLTDTPALRDAVAWAEKQGALVISSVGNDGNDTVYYPGAYSSSLCVGAVNDANSAPADFSNRNEAVDLLAPGEKLPTATMKGNRLLASGTSFSTAYISGVAAKLMKEYPDLTAAQIRQILYASATDFGTTGYDRVSGWGILNLEQALDYARQGCLFRDVDSSKWYFEGVRKAAKLGLFQGTSAVEFSPNQPTTRAMLWMMLYRLHGLKPSESTTIWYRDARLWVTANGISDGTNPNCTITREQMAVMLYGYASVFDYDIGKRADLSKFTDSDSISSYAKDALSWANASGLISGTGTQTLSPQGSATRAQVAVTVIKFYDLVFGGVRGT